MMFFLVVNVLNHALEIGLADREYSVTGLPTELSQTVRRFFDPLRRFGFDLLNEFRNRDGA